MLDRAKRLSSSPDLFSKECYDLRKMFLKLKYPVKLIDSIFKRFHASQDQNQSCIKPTDSPVLITLPFKDQKSADSVRKQLNDLGKKIDRVIQPVFTSRKISEDLKVTETKPSLVNQQCVVYEFQCNSCDSNYISYTSRHLHLRIEEHGLASATGFLKNNSVFDEKTSAQCYALIKVATEEAKDDFYDQLRTVVEQVPGSEDCHGRHER